MTFRDTFRDPGLTWCALPESSSSSSSSSILFLAYKHHLLDESTDHTCPRCREAPHTLKHWLDCPGTVQARMEIFGTTEQLPLSTLTDFLANRSHWQGVLCDVLGANIIVNNSSSSSSSCSSSSDGEKVLNFDPAYVLLYNNSFNANLKINTITENNVFVIYSPQRTLTTTCKFCMSLKFRISVILLFFQLRSSETF